MHKKGRLFKAGRLIGNKNSYSKIFNYLQSTFISFSESCYNSCKSHIFCTFLNQKSLLALPGSLRHALLISAKHN